MNIGKAVPSGYQENWAYRGRWSEKKLRKGLWKFTFKATKNRRAKSYGNMGKGTTGAWKIDAIQYIRKTGKGRYETTMKGTKKPLKFTVRHKR